MMSPSLDMSLQGKDMQALVKNQGGQLFKLCFFALRA
jgi:hypothetical protein